eukprot:1177805-Rhodomonas_salina.3
MTCLGLGVVCTQEFDASYEEIFEDSVTQHSSLLIRGCLRRCIRMWHDRSQCRGVQDCQRGHGPRCAYSSISSLDSSNGSSSSVSTDCNRNSNLPGPGSSWLSVCHCQTPSLRVTVPLPVRPLRGKAARLPA